MNIALDYDGTVTEDLIFWTLFASNAKRFGHKVYIVTMRYPSEKFAMPHPMSQSLLRIVDGVVFTSRQAKRPACEGLDIHIWIDDNPQAVDKSADEIWGAGSPEGEVVVENHGGLAP